MSVLDKAILILNPNVETAYSKETDASGNESIARWLTPAIPQPTPAQIQGVWAQAQAAQAKEDNNRPLLMHIAALESGQHRAVREAALNMAGAVARLQTLDASIAALRAKLI